MSIPININQNDLTLNNNNNNNIFDISISREEALQRFKQINWNVYTRNGAFSLTKEEIQSFQDIEKIMTRSYEQSELDEYLKKNGYIVCSGLMKLLKNVTDVTVIKYALARIEELLPDGNRYKKRMYYFCNNNINELDLSCFFRVLNNNSTNSTNNNTNLNNNLYIEYASSHLIAYFLSINDSSHVDTNFINNTSLLIDWCTKIILNNGNSERTRIAVATLSVLLRNNKARTLYMKITSTDGNLNMNISNQQGKGLQLLTSLLKQSVGKTQLIYEICFCFWLLSFCDEARDNFASSGALEQLIQQIEAAPREKVVRVSLAALKNLLSLHQEDSSDKGENTELMLDNNLLQTIKKIKDRKWTDEDIITDATYIKDILIREYKELTTMERYEKEVKNKKLHWNLLHTDKFWKENYISFEKKNFNIITDLIDLLLNEQTDNVTKAVALYDLGEFVRYYPNGKSLLKRFGAQKIVMRFLTNENAPEIQKQALQCVSKMMVNKWEYVK